MSTDQDRAVVITIDGEAYALLLTTRATKEISKRYGGLDKLGEKLMQADSFELALDEIIWLIVLMANQCIQIHNLRNKTAPKPLLTEEEVELLTVPSELSSFKPAIMEAMIRGTRRNVESDDDTKKPQAGEQISLV